MIKYSDEWRTPKVTKVDEWTREETGIGATTAQAQIWNYSNKYTFELLLLLKISSSHLFE